MDLPQTKTLVFSLLISSLFISLISCQSSNIPETQDGFWYGKKQTAAYESSVLIEAFFDPVCPDSRDSWPPLKQALNHYGPRVSLVFHTFPLPYHDNAFVSSRALHIVNKVNSSTTYDLLEAFFDRQEQFYGTTTLNMSRAAIIDQIVKFAANTVGSSYHSAIKSGFSDSKTDHATRVAFKYGCLRGVYGAPYFFVNGFPLSDENTPLDYKKWIQILDPLVIKEKQISLHFVE